MNTLTTEEIAWLVGGARRVALVTFVGLATGGRLEVAYRRQRVTVARNDAPDWLTAAALAPQVGPRQLDRRHHRPEPEHHCRAMTGQRRTVSRPQSRFFELTQIR
ncbi:hypothetical protein [Kribbella sp. NPDC055071]